jgi:hypothetical protein
LDGLHILVALQPAIEQRGGHGWVHCTPTACATQAVQAPRAHAASAHAVQAPHTQALLQPQAVQLVLQQLVLQLLLLHLVLLHLLLLHLLLLHLLLLLLHVLLLGGTVHRRLVEQGLLLVQQCLLQQQRVGCALQPRRAKVPEVAQTGLAHPLKGSGLLLHGGKRKPRGALVSAAWSHCKYRKWDSAGWDGRLQ